MKIEFKVYRTRAECPRDVHAVVSAIHKQTGMWVGMDTFHSFENVDVAFIIHKDFEKKLNPVIIKEIIDSVPDACDMNEFMVFEDMVIESDSNISLNVNKANELGTVINRGAFCKMFDDVYDVVEDGLMDFETA